MQFPESGQNRYSFFTPAPYPAQVRDSELLHFGQAVSPPFRGVQQEKQQGKVFV